MKTQSNGKPPMVLIADNDDDERCFLKAVLKRKGFNVVEASNGQEAIDLATQSAPDLLLIDLRLPRVSSLAVIRHLKNQAKLRRLKMATISLGASGVRQSRAVGSTAHHIEKPVEFDQFISLLDGLFPGQTHL